MSFENFSTNTHRHRFFYDGSFDQTKHHFFSIHAAIYHAAINIDDDELCKKKRRLNEYTLPSVHQAKINYVWVKLEFIEIDDGLMIKVRECIPDACVCGYVFCVCFCFSLLALTSELVDCQKIDYESETAYAYDLYEKEMKSKWNRNDQVKSFCKKKKIPQTNCILTQTQIHVKTSITIAELPLATTAHNNCEQNKFPYHWKSLSLSVSAIDKFIVSNNTWKEISNKNERENMFQKEI